jgi:hypothetical protein
MVGVETHLRSLCRYVTLKCAIGLELKVARVMCIHVHLVYPLTRQCPELHAACRSVMNT